MSATEEDNISDGTGEISSDDLTFNNLPNRLTLIRIFMVPVMVACLFQQTYLWDWAAIAVFSVAAITDYFDGYYARVRKQVSIYGKLMDPLADKFLVVSALVVLLHIDRIHPVVVILLICREMAITGLRAVASAEGLVIPATRLAKWKTAAQMVAIPCIMHPPKLWGVIPVYQIGHVLLYISLFISLWSAQDYIVDFFRAVRKKQTERAEKRKSLRAKKRAEKQTGSGGSTFN